MLINISQKILKEGERGSTAYAAAAIRRLLKSNNTSKIKVYHKLLLYEAACKAFPEKTEKEIIEYFEWLGFKEEIDFNLYNEKSQRELLWIYKEGLVGDFLNLLEELKLLYFKIKAKSKTEPELIFLYRQEIQPGQKGILETLNNASIES